MEDSRTACVTGGTSGIGKGIVKQFLSESYSVFALGWSNEHAQECKEELGESEKLQILVGDLCDERHRKDIVSSISSRHGKLDVLVNSAGVYLGAGGIDEPLDRWKQMLDINLISLFAITQACYPLLQRGSNASIVNISSACSLFPYSSCTSTCYSVSKAGVDLLTKRLALELAPEKIRVNAVNPGVVESDIWKRSGIKEEDYLKWKAEITKTKHPLGRTGEPEDIAHTVSFLASGKADWITGAIISVDGGYSVS
jgi:NAD(P)-dependent dehydrogenase (short-subunit alcohol dehydrogenase family)